MASIVLPSGLPRYCLGISFDMEEDRAFLGKYLELAGSPVPGERYAPEEVPKRAFIHRGNPRTIPDFVAISGRMALSPEARAGRGVRARRAPVLPGGDRPRPRHAAHPTPGRPRARRAVLRVHPAGLAGRGLGGAVGGADRAHWLGPELVYPKLG